MINLIVVSLSCHEIDKVTTTVLFLFQSYCNIIIFVLG